MTYCFGILIEHFEVEIENARIGASGLLLDIERQLFHWVTGRYKINPGPISWPWYDLKVKLTTLLCHRLIFSLLLTTLKCATKVRRRPRAGHVVNQISFSEWTGEAETLQEDCCNAVAEINLFIKEFLVKTQACKPWRCIGSKLLQRGSLASSSPIVSLYKIIVTYENRITVRHILCFPVNIPRLEWCLKYDFVHSAIIYTDEYENLQGRESPCMYKYTNENCMTSNWLYFFHICTVSYAVPWPGH